MNIEELNLQLEKAKVKLKEVQNEIYDLELKIKEEKTGVKIGYVIEISKTIGVITSFKNNCFYWKKIKTNGELHKYETSISYYFVCRVVAKSYDEYIEILNKL